MAALAAGSSSGSSGGIRGQSASTTSSFALRHGLVYTGLERTRGGPCGTLYQIEGPGPVRCTHGPDPSPASIDVRHRRSLAALRATVRPAGAAKSAAPSAVPCVGDGRSGDRVEAVYAHPAGTPDRFDEVAPLIRKWAAQVEQTYERSAAETSGRRQIRWVTDSSCQLVVRDLVARADSAPHTFIDLALAKLTQHDRKYVVWMDANVLCGMGESYLDDTPWSSNKNDGPDGTPAMAARIDEGCWGLYENPDVGSVEAHELTHTLGAVLGDAPHATHYGHCTDRYDVMCYVDGPGTVLHTACPKSHQPLLDCNHDDYFSTNPPPSSWLATHWNTANNSFLVGGQAPPPPPPPPGARCTVPAVAGSSLTSAVKRLTAAHCSLGTLTSAYSPTVAIGRVISVSPKSGTVLSAFAQVSILISKGVKPPPPPTHCRVPSLVGKAFLDAVSPLLRAGCGLRVTQAYSSKVGRGRIASQSPRPGKVLKLYSKVLLVISKGRSPHGELTRCAVPAVTGKTLSKAVRRLQKSGCTPVMKHRYSTQVRPGYIISQSPAAGKVLPLHGKVVVVMSLGRKPKRRS